jgi:ribosome modulation factor
MEGGMPKDQAAKAVDNLSGDEEQALFISHLSKLRLQQKKVAEAKLIVDAERAVLNDLFHMAKVDKFSRKELTAILGDSLATRRNLQAEEERRALLRQWAGLPVGSQGELFAKLPEEAADEQTYEGEGYSAGLRGDERDVPEHVSPRFMQAWSRGWIAGQEKNVWAMAASAAAKKAPEPEAPAAEVEEIDVDKEARKLKAKGFLEHSPDLEPAA